MIRPFRGLRYDGPALAAGWEALVSQPYDKIDPRMLASLRERSPYNVVHLIRGEGGPDDRSWHARAGETLRAWIAAGVLRREEAPAFYVYTQTFRDAKGRERTRRGITGVFDLTYRDRVRHHERTHAEARADRRRLLDATGCDFGQVFLLRHEGPKLPPKILRKLDQAAEVREEDGVVHRFARLADAKAQRVLEETFSASRFLIADGHHRFSVACDHADADPAGDGCVLVTCVDLDDEGLVVLPTHRSLSGLSAAERVRLLHAVQALGAEPRPFGPTADAFVEEAERRGPGTIGIVLRGGGFLWSPDVGAARTELERLDAFRLEHDLLGGFLVTADEGARDEGAGGAEARGDAGGGEAGGGEAGGGAGGGEAAGHERPAELGEARHRPSGRLAYRRDGRAAAAEVLARAADAAFLLAPVTPRGVADVAEGGEVMPAKTTDFYPKMLSGFVFHDLDR